MTQDLRADRRATRVAAKRAENAFDWYAHQGTTPAVPIPFLNDRTGAKVAELDVDESGNLALIRYF